MTALYVDADACPVKAEAERVATRHGIRMFVVSNGGLRPSANPLVETVIVAAGPDEADKWIAERAGPGDVVVTADIPLAARCVEAGARVVKPNGEALTAATEGMHVDGVKSFFWGLCVAAIVLFRPQGLWPWLYDLLGLGPKREGRKP